MAGSPTQAWNQTNLRNVTMLKRSPHREGGGSGPPGLKWADYPFKGVRQSYFRLAPRSSSSDQRAIRQARQYLDMLHPLDRELPSFSPAKKMLL